MDTNDLPNDIVHPEVRAHITSLVSALGGVDEDGQYQLGDDALDVLRDIKKWIRFYDQKLNRMDVARCLAETNLVSGDLLRILATWKENSEAQRFKARIALACYEILTPLTWPLEKDVETATVNHYRHLPALQLAQVAYKRAIVNFDGAQILHTAVRVALPSMAVAVGDRSLRDHGIIKLVLFLLRNVAMIEPPPGIKYEGDESQVSRSATIDAFSYQDIFLVLLTIASNMGDEFRTEDTAVLEILFHLIKRVDIPKLFMDNAQLNKANADELTDMMNKESAMLQAFNHNGPTRHSRFGTMVWVDRGQGKMTALSGQDALVSAAARELKMDNSKKFRPPRRPRRRDEKLELMGLGPSVALNARAGDQLRKFVEEFLDAGFNPLFQHVRKSIDREAPHVLHYHRTQFLYLVSWFLEAERVRQKAHRNRKDQGGKQASAEEISSFNLVAAVLNQEMFVFLGRALDRSYNDKDWQELTVVMRCFTQILLTVQEMFESKNEDDVEIAENILSRLFYEEATHDAIANIVKTFKDQGYEYLDACTELAHTYLRILESYSKQNVDLQVRSRRRTRKKKKTAAAAAAAAAAVAAAGGDALNESGEIGDAVHAGRDEDDESADDEAMAQKTSTERKFDFKRFAARFLAQGVVDTFVKFTTNYADLTDLQLKRAHRYFYRVAFKQEMSVMLFRVDIMRLLFNMIKGPEPLDKSRPMFKEWEELVKQIIRKCVKKIEERPVLIIEMLFSKSASTAHFLEYGYEKQTVATTKPRPGAELEFRHVLERDRQIAIAVGVLLDKNQHEHIYWVKKQLAAAEAERRAWQVAVKAMASATANATAEPSLFASIETDNGLDGASGLQNETAANAAVPTSEAPSITIRTDDDNCKKAMFKNSHLRLLMKLVGFERREPLAEETPDSAWSVPPSVTAERLQESLEFVNRAEFAPPVFENDESAESQLRRKSAASRKKKASYDDDGDNTDGLEDDAILFPAGGPTARKVIDAALDGRKKIRRRRRKQLDGSGDDGELEGPTEEELDERARRRRQKELEKARRIKSDLYVHASDDETDDEKDREFFAREEAIRQRVHKSIMINLVAGSAKAAKASKPKRKLVVLSDDEDENEDDDEAAEKSARGASHEPTSIAYRSRKRRKSTEDALSSDDEDVVEGAGAGNGESDSDNETLPNTVARANSRRKQQGGFVDSSSDEDEDLDNNDNHEEDGSVNADADAMDTDNTPLSSSPHPVVNKQPDKASATEPVPPLLATEKGRDPRLLLNGPGTNDDGDDDDSDDALPAAGKKRPRAKSGFVLDSDDE
ncbi:Timeless protein [Niveomyces insectorum RCEF 264]|uniref:Topoisomerase 1-associated factor 1 n=1 Tax=Niveomyces insectorum RCEF 264 TaxID=1081102 RepID=A0A168AGU0_9HYPO|nr:Timeless protein [Niveomyces insectorum RCEF 264]